VLPVTTWLDARHAALGGNKRPDAAFAELPVASGASLAIDLGALTSDADGDVLSYALSHVGSSLGGTLSILAALVLVQVFRDGPITSHRIQGAIVVYLLLGLIWMSAYKLLLRTVPGAIHFASGEPSSFQSGHGLAYYSFVTLTTVGYGDITPVHPVARSLAAGEALVGQLYPAILIARLVSMQLASRDQK
jgi:hypothetical protein